METAQAQGQMNRETAITQYGLGATNQITPFGSLNYDQIGSWSDGTPRFQSTQTQSPQMQKITNALMGGAGNLTGQIAATTQKPLSFTGLPQYATSLNMQGAPGLVGKLDTSKLAAIPGADDFSADRQRVEGALMDRLNPQLSKERGALEARLASQGLVYGNEAYGGAMDDYGRQANDARLAVIGQAGDEQQRMFNMGLGARQQGFNELLSGGAFSNQARQQFSNEALTNANLQNAARQGGMQEILTQRNQPINELAALLSSTQMQQPNYVNTPQPPVAGVDYTGLVNQQYQSQLQSYQSGMGGLFGLGSALIGALPFSDERLKTDIERVGETDEGTPIYTYRMKAGGPMQMGIMAQDIESDNPEAVFMHPSGFKMVNYDLVK